MRTIKISEFKAKCIEELKQVEHSGEPILVTLRNQPLVTIHAYRETRPSRVLGALRGRATINGDIVHADTSDDWEMES